ncbi:hypothetical protein NTD84_00670 [Pseudomonas sp. 14P_8.1_Bac3]|uniref:hypothetical protein n=1 Tax=Pseudomonas sp. 14P_8.1_Bac3 TaxID=2971621 RepID=UPI0021C6D7BB|nr:hypothetical protein [Pseudomonas sp. 14P_8.1_Bac3]MCU1758235.1 hypothetical protein [Pseudomonas sp. 14P_8.1_Bac3]
MSSDRKQSFTATLGTDASPLHFLNKLHAKRAIVTSSLSSGGFFTGRRQSRDDSHFLGLRQSIPIDAVERLSLYFRYTGEFYRLYIRTPGAYYGKCLSVADDGLLGAFPPEGSTKFSLINKQGVAMTLDHLTSDWATLYLQARDSGLLHAHRVQDSPFIYIADKGAQPLSFNLRIAQRNAPYLSNPDEI